MHQLTFRELLSKARFLKAIGFDSQQRLIILGMFLLGARYFYVKE